MDTIIDFLASESDVDILSVIINILLAAITSQLVYAVFLKFGNTFSNRKHFGKIFLLVTVSTSLIITVIQASVALSLGLVGALSIIRFRAAIKEPEELAYTFFCIAIGLGFGANEIGLTTIAALLILAILVVRGLITRKGFAESSYNFCVVTGCLTADDVLGILEGNAESIQLRRIDSGKDSSSIAFEVQFKSAARLNAVVEELKAADADANVICTAMLSC